MRLIRAPKRTKGDTLPSFFAACGHATESLVEWKSNGEEQTVCTRCAWQITQFMLSKPRAEVSYGW